MALSSERLGRKMEDDDFKKTQNLLICYLVGLGMQLETWQKNVGSTPSEAFPSPNGALDRTGSVFTFPDIMLEKYHSSSYIPHVLAQLLTEPETSCFRATSSMFLIFLRSSYSRCDLQVKSTGTTYLRVRERYRILGSIPNLLNQKFNLDKNP